MRFAACTCSTGLFYSGRALARFSIDAARKQLLSLCKDCLTKNRRKNTLQAVKPTLHKDNRWRHYEST